MRSPLYNIQPRPVTAASATRHVPLRQKTYATKRDAPGLPQSGPDPASDRRGHLDYPSYYRCDPGGADAVRVMGIAGVARERAPLRAGAHVARRRARTDRAADWALAPGAASLFRRSSSLYRRRCRRRAVGGAAHGVDHAPRVARDGPYI